MRVGSQARCPLDMDLGLSWVGGPVHSRCDPKSGIGERGTDDMKRENIALPL